MPKTREELLEAARTLSREQFVQQSDRFFFAFSLTGTGDEWARIEFKTGSYRAAKRKTITIQLLENGQPAPITALLPPHILSIVKSNRNPYSDRISIGRSSSNDLIISSPQISKLHAHFMGDTTFASFALRDSSSTNGTYLNGARLEPGVPIPLQSGNAIRLGPCDGRFLDAGHLFDLLKPMV